MTGLILERIRKRFGESVAVDGVSLEIGTGEFVSLVGGSGCGKTTLLRIIAGFTRADSGRVLIDGRDVASEPPHRRQLGFVFQSYALFPTMSVAENIGFALRLARRPKAEIASRVAELCALAELDGMERRYPDELSGGQQQRVALVRALAPNPRILLLDEPLSALDAQIRASLRWEIRRIVERLGVTAVYVTHDQEEAFAISDRVAVMSGGRLLQVGVPMDVYLRPSSLAVAGFIGVNNRIDARSVDGELVAANGWRLGLRAPGGDHVICVRPEHIELTAVNGATVACADPVGKLASVMFLGQMVRLSIESGGRPIMADIPATQWLDLGIRTGDAIAWRPRAGRAVVFPARS